MIALKLWVFGPGWPALAKFVVVLALGLPVMLASCQIMYAAVSVPVT